MQIMPLEYSHKKSRIKTFFWLYRIYYSRQKFSHRMRAIIETALIRSVSHKFFLAKIHLWMYLVHLLPNQIILSTCFILFVQQSVLPYLSFCHNCINISWKEWLSTGRRPDNSISQSMLIPSWEATIGL